MRANLSDVRMIGIGAGFAAAIVIFQLFVSGPLVVSLTVSLVVGVGSFFAAAAGLGEWREDERRKELAAVVMCCAAVSAVVAALVIRAVV